MKKILAMILALVMCLSLAACGGGDDVPPADGDDGEGDAPPASELNVGVFYYTFADAYRHGRQAQRRRHHLPGL